MSSISVENDAEARDGVTGHGTDTARPTPSPEDGSLERRALMAIAAIATEIDRRASSLGPAAAGFEADRPDSRWCRAHCP